MFSESVIETVIVGILAALIGYLLAALIKGRHVQDARAKIAQLELRIEQANHLVQSTEQRLGFELDEHKDTIMVLRERLEQAQQQQYQLEKHVEVLQAEKAVFETRLTETKQSLATEFENLANRIFDEKGKNFNQATQTNLEHLLSPFREQIDRFQARINQVHDAALQGNAHLNSEIKKVLETGLKMSQEATNLTSALKGDSQQRGAWGEAQLRRTLEMSGLIEDAHFEVQTAFKDAEGKQKQTDYLIKLPDNKHLIIDSKVALNAYDRAVGATTPEAYQLAMQDHIRAVRKHIDDLASKDYTNLIGMHSPNFVLMFMPVEPAYIEALKSNKELFEYGYQKGIILVSHTTLIPILRTVSNLWMIERSNAEAKEISERAGEIYNQVCIVAERLSKLGNTLSTVSNHYNHTVTALVGQQGLYGKVDRFSQLSTKITKQLPPIAPSPLDFEADRLALIVEPVFDPEE